jgi:translation elongation factor EF-Ts
MNSYQLSLDKVDKENKIIQDILHNNGYNASTLKSISNSKKHECGTEKTHWSEFTYVGKETRAITKVLKNTRVKVTYSTNNTLGRLLTKKRHPLKNKYEN